ncbi:MAG: SRPBCC domain-containing protein [Bdellovibrionota bacterium]
MSHQDNLVMKVERIANAPVDLVFAVWTKAEHLDHWWGPHGFSTTTSSMTFVVGGSWEFLMEHAEYGKFPNYIKYLEIEENKKIIYDHGSSKDTPPDFRSTITFEGMGTQTKVTLLLRFNSESVYTQEKEHNAESSGMETLEKMEKYAQSQL